MDEIKLLSFEYDENEKKLQEKNRELEQVDKEVKQLDDTIKWVVDELFYNNVIDEIVLEKYKIWLQKYDFLPSFDEFKKDLLNNRVKALWNIKDILYDVLFVKSQEHSQLIIEISDLQEQIKQILEVWEEYQRKDEERRK